VVSPGSRSTPIIAALVGQRRLALPTIIDERAAAFYALGAARATGQPVALVCTSGSAVAHYLPAIVEAHEAGVPLVLITANRPAELQDCGASQTIDQTSLFGSFARAFVDLGAPTGTAFALRALQRKLAHAVATARGPVRGPVHVDVPLRKPLEPARPETEDERALASVCDQLRAHPVHAAPPRSTADDATLDALARAIADEPAGLIVAGALPAEFANAREAVFELARASGYPLFAEATSQLRFAPRPAEVAVIDAFDLITATPSRLGAPAPRLVIQLGAELVASAARSDRELASAPVWVIAERWRDPTASARGIVLGDPRATIEALVPRVRALVATRSAAFADAWRMADARARAAIEAAIAAHPTSEVAAVRDAMRAAPTHAALQIGNSLPVRAIDYTAGGGAARVVLSQRGAAGIDGMIASATGATRAGNPVVLVLGDVSFAHDLGGLLVARQAVAPLAIVVIDNGGGQIFSGLPIANAGLGEAFDHHFLTAPNLDPSTIAAAIGVRATPAATATIGDAVRAALAANGPTVIHVPVSPTGVRDVRAHALAVLGALASPIPSTAEPRSARGSHA